MTWTSPLPNDKRLVTMKVLPNNVTRRSMMNNITRIGIDLAKNSFSICAVDSNDKIVLERDLKRKELLEFFANTNSCIVAMEAGSGAHHWARELTKLGHDARIIDPKLVIPYRTRGRISKNDRNDARAICEAAGRPHMRFVPIKDQTQQAILLIHRRRKQLVVDHTSTVNQIRGHLAEFGIVVPKGVNTLKNQWPTIRMEHTDHLPAIAWQELDALFADLLQLHKTLLAYDRKIKALNRQDERTKQILKINGVGELTASAIVATVGNAALFKNGRQFAAWLGLTPREYSTGGKTRLGRISKRGDTYLRTLLVHGARSELMFIHKRNDNKSQWAEHLRETKSWNKTAVALANKHARIIWAVLAKNEDYHPA
jgi:transposase